MNLDSITRMGWTLDEALKVIRELQVIAKQSNLHLALAGSVLNEGTSVNDLDIICLKILDNNPCNFEQFILRLQTHNNIKDITIKTGENYLVEGRTIYGIHYKLDGDTKQIDLFWYDK